MFDCRDTEPICSNLFQTKPKKHESQEKDKHKLLLMGFYVI